MHTFLDLIVRPITTWPRPLTKHRKRSTFSASYAATMILLDRELRHLNAKQPLLQMAYVEGDLRLDGRPRANAEPQHPGVMLSFDTPRGPLQFPCDRFTKWVDNLRAIALALEAFRKVDRYGVTSFGEQYTGWKALPSPDSYLSNADAAALYLSRLLGTTVDTLYGKRWRFFSFGRKAATERRIAELRSRPRPKPSK